MYEDRNNVAANAEQDGFCAHERPRQPRREQICARLKAASALVLLFSSLARELLAASKAGIEIASLRHIGQRVRGAAQSAVPWFSAGPLGACDMVPI